ncbi:hypothetical protein BDY19DRAFT_896653 [Irpex rosettiformis]|uniref:Uncharacterized protein n=1 Tax=Irpex rosettiformis TaxID=378272 RepID=A0ACB8TU02_9APHY|nr:hypothetical protein BDY19DRAFT_896653 [Irpex rosettiformis]
MLSLSPHILESIASGAHYSGALSPTQKQTDEHVEGKLMLRHVRSLSRSGKEPAVEEAYRDVMNDLEELFCGRATRDVLERRIANDAQFEDPWCKCTGFNETAAKFVAVSKLYSKCERQESRILSGSLHPNELVFSQKQMYTFRLFGMKRTVISFVHVWLDDEFKVVRIVDEWNGEELPTGRGMLLLRKFNGKMASWFFHVPKE